jgi:transcriptional regulator with XRE-family HTH domain
VRNTRKKQDVRRLREGCGGGRHRTPEGVSQDMAREGTRTADSPLTLFCRRLKHLQQTSGLTQTSLAVAANVSTSQMSDMLNGRIVKAPSWDVVRCVVQACLAHAEKTSRPVPAGLRDEKAWRQRHFDLEQDLETEPHPRPDIQMASGQAVKTVRECDPFDLEVHRALPPTGAASTTVEPDFLTPYLQRGHDEELRAALRLAAGGGPSVFAVLAGDSSTGKTRALYEGLCEVVPDWPLLRPADADELLELLHAGRFLPETVLWLNETQRHLYGVQGERAAKLLRTALAAINGAVAVGALWSRPYLEELTARGDSPDVHVAARALLDGHRTHCITVPDCLTSQEQSELGVLARGDERLRIALAASGADGDVIQHLTGGPELLHAYSSGGFFNQVEHALVTAALDARRLGHRGAIPVTLLAAAADGYLSPRQRPGHPNWTTLAVSALPPASGATAPELGFAMLLPPSRRYG